MSDGVVEQCDPMTSHVETASCGPTTQCRVGGRGFAACVSAEVRTCDPSTYVARCFDRWRKFDSVRQTHAQAALERIRDSAGLSRDVAEIITKALA